MHLSENHPGRRGVSEPAGSDDSLGDPEEPVFPAWADSDELAAPEIPLLSSWEPEPPPEFQALSPGTPLEVPGDVPMPPTTESAFAPDASQSLPNDISANPAFQNPLVEATDDGRRARRKEWAARLWERGPTGAGEGDAPYLHPG